MSTKMLLTAKLDQRLVMNQQLTQAITLLQYTTLDLKQLVKQYVETNPLIDLEDEQTDTSDAEYEKHSTGDQENSSYFLQNRGHTVHSDYGDSENIFENYCSPKSLREHLLEQTSACHFNLSQQVIAENIIDAIDDNGYLTMSLDEIKQSLPDQPSFSLAMIESVLKQIHQFDPAGIAARDICECLLLQLAAKTQHDPLYHFAHKLLTEHFDVLSINPNKPILKKIGMTLKEYQGAFELIRTLNPKPGQTFNHEIDHNIEPDLFVKKVKNEWCVFLTKNFLTNIKINNEYLAIIKKNKKHASYEKLNLELQEAQWLIKGLKKRNETLLNVATHIIKLQKDFIEYGQAFMKPLNIIDISQALSLHESTVSRVTTGKYIATPRGFFELKYFFPSYVLTESGETCSDTAVKELIKEVIQRERTNAHIYSDQEIALFLKEKGIHIARRTVAKYRTAMKILPSYQRALLSTRDQQEKLKSLSSEENLCSD